MWSNQISTLVSKQLAAKIQKLNKSVRVDTTLTAQKAAPNDEQYLMSALQCAVAKHFATQPIDLPNPQPSNWKSIIKKARSKST